MTLLIRVKLLCKIKGITVKELEENLDFPPGTVYQWKNRYPGLYRLISLSDYFNVSIDYLVGRDRRI